MKAAEYVRKAGEAFERFGGSLGGLADALATMSREFDPLGYKTAFRALGRQTEIIKQQSEIIQAFQAREIERLRNENQQLRERLGRIEQRKPRVAEQFWLNLYLVDKSRIPFTLSAQGVDMSSILMSDFMVEYNSERRDEYGPLLSQSFAL
ncbi:MAG: hypothetical protein IH987_14435 [Planctomycetes bacterium]|nr:hypothetical protein [Planctomycetota bacterium]